MLFGSHASTIGQTYGVQQLLNETLQYNVDKFVNVWGKILNDKETTNYLHYLSASQAASYFK